MAAISTRVPDVKVIVFYDSRGKRTSKEFTDPYEARRFYMAKDREGRRPRLLAEKQ